MEFNEKRARYAGPFPICARRRSCQLSEVAITFSLLKNSRMSPSFSSS
jgi:hypothetical protein